MIITKTPFRVSLFGGGPDHPALFRNNGGKVLSFSIDKYCYLTTRILPPFFEHNYRIAYSNVETEKNFECIKHPVVREVIRKYAPNLRLEIHHDGDLPARSGIGSSAAFTVGMIHALSALRGTKLTPEELANHAIELECEILKENTGWQDQIACSLGGLNLINFQNAAWTFTPLNLPPKRKSELNSRMVLVFSGISRQSSDITAGLLESIEKKRKVFYRLIEMADIASTLILNNGDLDVIGEMLEEGWRLKTLANPRAHHPLLDDLYQNAKIAGAIGGKVLGAGGGGFMLFWLRSNSLESFRSKFRGGTIIDFAICEEGSSLIFNSSGD